MLELLLLLQFLMNVLQCVVPETQFVLLVEALVQDCKDIDDVIFLVEVIGNGY